MSKRWTEEETRFLKENYCCLSCPELEAVLGRGQEAIKQKASKLGLEKFPDNIAFFEKWTELSAYVLGFWAADGYVNVRKHETRFSISQTRDKQILEDIKALMGRGTVCWIHQTLSWRYEFASKKLYQVFNDLFGHDVRHKSRTLQWPAIADEHVRHFVRGYCDGDAHVGISKRGEPQLRVSSGSRAFIDALLSHVERLAGIQGTTHTTKLGTNLALYTNIKGICLADWLYSDCTLAIEQKRAMAAKIAVMRMSRVNGASITPKMLSLFPEILAAYPNLR